MSKRPVVVVTGGTGSVMSLFLSAEMRRPVDRQFVLLVRADNDEAAAARVTRLFDRVLPGGAAAAVGRWQAFAADITMPGVGLSDAGRDVVLNSATHVLNGAGDVGFRRTFDRSSLTNVAGTKNVIELALAMRQLHRFVHVSTLYVWGATPGDPPEAPLSELGTRPWHNTYEETKAQAERLVWSRLGPTLATVARPSIVVGSHVDGYIKGFDVVYPLLALLARRQLPVLRAWPQAKLDIVSGEFVAEALSLLLLHPDAAGQTVHLAAGRDAVTVGGLVAEASELLEVTAPRLIEPSEGPIPRLLASGDVDDAGAKTLRFIDDHYGDGYLSVRWTAQTEVRDQLLGPWGVSPMSLFDYLPLLIAFFRESRLNEDPAYFVSRGEWLTRLRAADLT